MGLDVTYKGSQIAQLTEDGNLTLETAGKYCEGDIELAYTGGGDQNPVADINDVVFVDYDGVIRYSYTAEEFLALEELPPGPNHEGLVFEEWSWTLSDAKEYVGKYWGLIVGAFYHGEDNWNAIILNIPDMCTLRLTMAANNLSAGPVLVDWGDGSPQEDCYIQTGNVSKPHTYGKGRYKLRFKYYDAVAASYAGVNSIILDGFNSNNEQRFAACSMIEELHCGGLNPYYNRFTAYGAFNVKAVAVSKTQNIHSLYAANKVIMSININSYGSVLWKAFIKNSMIGSNGGGEYNCCPWICLPEASTLGNIGGSKLTHLRIPATITSIVAGGISVMRAGQWVQFYPTTPPTVANSNAWTNIPASCAFIVPIGSLDDYLISTNYPSQSTYLYLGWYRGTNGETLPTTQGNYILTWYASIDDAKSEANPITEMQGREVFCRYATIENND